MLNSKDILQHFALLGYIDPGTGSMLISALIATISVIFYALKDKLYYLFYPKGNRGKRIDPNKHYKLIYYSEGKQYWNVFEPLLEEGGKRGIESLYLTSDKEDPGLLSNIDGAQTIYIGSGRESYFNLNRLNATMVVMTTPGLDVLGIKRSKNVKHYAHITHATSSSGTYKAFGTDYFDSVLVGGEGTFELLRELEEARDLPEKEIEIIGHTYLDLLRKKIQDEEYEYSLFKDKRKTILLSPTWGDHGLLSKYGDEILGLLEESNEYNLIIRPHPQSFISEKETMSYLMDKYPDTDQRVWDMDRENIKAMTHADIMISDFSGIIFDFFTLFKKPIITLKSQYEKRGREAMYLKEDPWDLKILDDIGAVIEGDNLNNLIEVIEDTINNFSFKTSDNENINRIIDRYPNESAKRGLDFIEKTLKNLEVAEKVTEEKRGKANYLNEDFTFNPAPDGNKPWILKVLTAIFDTGFLIQIGLALSLLFIYIVVGAKFLPKGRNADFLKILTPYMSLLLIAFGLIFLLIVFVFKKGQVRFIKAYEKASFPDVLFILLPLTPIVQYIFANQDVLTIDDSLILIGIFSVVSFVAVVILPLVLSPIIAKLFTIPITSVFMYTLINMSSFYVMPNGKKIMLIIIPVLGLTSFFLLFLKQKKILLALFVFLFIGNSIYSFSNILKSEDSSEYNLTKNKVADYTLNMEIENTPDVFIMIYDAYSNQETMDLYGYDNSEQMEFLQDNGFAIYDGTYSVGAGSIESMSQVLHMDKLKDASIFRRHIAGEANAVKFFQSKGYVTHLLLESDYNFRGFEPTYDTLFPPLDTSIEGYKIILRAILEGEFRFDIDFSNASKKSFSETREKLLSQNLSKPEFMYYHINLPDHSQNSGVLLPDETERYLTRLEEANATMKKDIYDLKLLDRDAIVIIAADHGPYLTKNGIGLGGYYSMSEVDRLDIQDRYGTLLAIYWPDMSYAEKYDIKTIQDVLPAVISYMYEDDSLYDKLRMSNLVEKSKVIAGAGIDNGIIVGGINDGEPLFENNGIRYRD